MNGGCNLQKALPDSEERESLDIGESFGSFFYMLNMIHVALDNNVIQNYYMAF